MNPIIIGDATLYLGDCMDILPTLGKVDAVITDPPYGINYVASAPNATKHSKLIGDDGTLDLRLLLSMDCPVIAWGANCYPEQLPHRGRWLCWDKRGGIASADKMLGSPFELAWMNKTSGYDSIFRLLHGGVVNNDAVNAKREHPTQKPIRLMVWCIEQVKKTPETILDPFMGSGTTGVAAIQLGRKFIGIEREPKYFDIACQRIEQAVAQGQLFAPEPMKQTQEVLL
jgi:site-specific DNA-methyltransferase (adenine-specific)